MGKATNTAKPGTGVRSDKAFFGLTDAAVAQIRQAGVTEEIKPEASVFKEVPQHEKAFLVLQGAVRIQQGMGDSRLHLVTLRPGDWMASSSFLPQGGLGLSAIAAAPTRVFKINREGWKTLPWVLRLYISEREQRLATQHLGRFAGQLKTLAATTRYLGTVVPRRSKPLIDRYEDDPLLRSTIDNLPRLPLFVTQLIALLQDETSSGKEVVELARQDPSIVAETMKAVNSAAYGLSQQVKDFHHAVMLVGFDEMYRIVLGAGLRQVMPDTPDFRALHDHAVAISHTAHEIAKLAKLDRPAVHGTVGMLHDLGRGVVLLLKKKNPKLDLLLDHLDAPAVGGLLLKTWNLPEVLWHTVRCQAFPGFTPPALLPEACRETLAVLYLAQLCDRYLQGENEAFLTQGFFDAYMRRLKLADLTLVALVNRHILPSLEKKGGKRIFTAKA